MRERSVTVIIALSFGYVFNSHIVPANAGKNKENIPSALSFPPVSLIIGPDEKTCAGEVEHVKKRKHVWLDLVACFFIPAYTLLFAGSLRWFRSNFSVIAVTGADHYRGFVVWGLLTGGYFLFMLVRLAGLLPRPGARAAVLILTTLALMSLGYALAIPYLPTSFPQYAALHVLLAALSCMLLMGTLLLILLSLNRAEPGRWRKPLLAWWGIVAVSGVLFLIAGIVSTALEVFFTIAATLLARDIWLRSQR